MWGIALSIACGASAFRAMHALPVNFSEQAEQNLYKVIANDQGIRCMQNRSPDGRKLKILGSLRWYDRSAPSKTCGITHHHRVRRVESLRNEAT